MPRTLESILKKEVQEPSLFIEQKHLKNKLYNYITHTYNIY